MSKLSPNQMRVLDAIRAFTQEFQRPPTIDEISERLQFSRGHVSTIAANLRNHGHLHNRRGLHLPDSPFLRPTEAACQMGISRSHLNALMARGEVTSTQSPGGYRLVHIDEIERFITGRYTPRFEVDFDVDNDWANWLVGFTDGEGTFSLVEHNHQGHGHYYGSRYQLFQRADRRWILEQVKENLHCGNLYIRHVVTKPSGPGSYFVVNDHASLTNIVIPFFDKYPPRMKHREYAVWREATQLITQGNHNIERVAELRETLRELYKYHE